MCSLFKLTGHTYYIYSVVFSPNGEYLASESNDCTIGVWSVSSGERINTLTGHFDKVLSVTFSPIGEFLASGSFSEIRVLRF